MCVSVSKNLCALPQMQNRDHSAEVVKYASALGDPVWGSVTSPAGLRGPGDSPAGWSPRRPAGITQETGQIWGQLRLRTWVLFLHVVAAGLVTCFFCFVFVFVFYCSQILLQKVVPRALCRLMECSHLLVLFGMVPLRLPLPGHFS